MGAVCGPVSDAMVRGFGLRGRMWSQFATRFMEAAFPVAFGSLSDEQPVKLADAALFTFSVSRDVDCGIPMHTCWFHSGTESGCSSRCSPWRSSPARLRPHPRRAPAQAGRHIISACFQMRSYQASATTNIFGLTNLFARSSGGIFNDVMLRRLGWMGRACTQLATLVQQAVSIFACVSVRLHLRRPADGAVHQGVFAYSQMLRRQASAMTRTFGLSGLFPRPLGGVLRDECSPGSAFWGRGMQFFSEAFFLPNFGTTSDERPVQSATTVLSIFSVVRELG